MSSALDGFLKLECDERMAGSLRAEVEAAGGQGYDHFEFDLFDVELFYGENRVTVREASPLGYSDAEVTFEEFLAAIPDVTPQRAFAGTATAGPGDAASVSRIARSTLRPFPNAGPLHGHLARSSQPDPWL